MKIKQTIIKSLMITIVVILGISISMPIFATTEGTRNLYLSTPRYIDGEYTKGYMLNIERDELNHTIYQIMAENNDTNYYCLNAEVGEHWKLGQSALYNKGYNLNDKNEIEALLNDSKAMLSESGKSNIVEILWVLENIYISNPKCYVGSEEERLKEKRELLANAGLIFDNHDYYGNEDDIYRYRYVKQQGFDNYYDEQKYGNIISNGINVLDGYFYKDENGQYKVVELNDDLVEVAQQAALWYFANFDKNAPEDTKRYNVREYGLQLLQKEGSSAWKALMEIKENDVEVGKMQQDMATILCWYLIDAAEKYAEEVKNLQDFDAKMPSGNPLSIAPTTANIIEKNVNNKNYYVVGPIEIKENRVAVYSLNNTISINEDTNTGAYISDSNGNKKSDQIVANYVGKNDLYISVPKSKVNGNNIQISFDGTYKTNKKTLWINSSSIEQPIVEVEPGKQPLYLQVNAPINKQFDLALRKVITGIKDKNGNDKTLINEAQKAATRIVNINTNTIATTGTSTFNHRKDPIVVEQGDIIKYKIEVYNEGEMEGYAKTIVDKLPTGLKFKEPETDTINGMTYFIMPQDSLDEGGVVPCKYSYQYNEEKNEIILTNKTKHALSSYEGDNRISKEYIEIECEVTQVPSSIQNTYLTNIAYITGTYNTETNEDVITDRDSSVQNSPSNYTQNNTGAEYDSKKWYNGGNNHNGDSTKDVYKDGTNNDDYFQGREDDDDFEIVVVKPQAFDLALQKYISKIYSVDGKTSRDGKNAPKIDTQKLANGTATTATYTQDKTPLKVKNGEYVLYTFTAYNEGDIDAIVTEITDNIPTGLQFVCITGDEDEGKVTVVNSDGTSSEEAVSSDIYSKALQYNGFWVIEPTKDTYNGESTISIKCKVNQASPEMEREGIKAYSKEEDKNFDGTGLSKASVQVLLRVSEEDGKGKTIRNEAAITEATDKDGNIQDVSELRDRDSQTKPVDNVKEPWPGKDGDKNYQDDEDYDSVKLGKVDLALTKFITAISEDTKIEDGEYLTANQKEGSKENPYDRQTAVNTNPLKNGTSTDAIYTQDKSPLPIPENYYILYNIRVYNEGDCDVYAGEVTDYLPDYLDFVANDDFNNQYGWKVEADGKTVKTDYLSKAKNPDKILKAFDSVNDDGKGSKLDYYDLPILCKINSSAPDKAELINSAEITKYEDENGTQLPKDVDSEPNNLVGKNQKQREQDDDDFEVVEVVKRKNDLALTKFIVAISEDAKIEDGEYLTADKKEGSKTNPYDRQTAVNTKPLKDRTSTDAIYTQDKSPLSIPENSYILYNIRVYNEGDTDVYAGEVTDYLPNYLDYVSTGEANIKYGWKVESDGKTVKTDYLSKEKNQEKILTAFDRINDDEKGSGLDYEDLQILCKVNSSASNKTKLINSAEITKYEDKNGNEIEKDVDSEPNNLKEKNKENREQDDDDYEVVEVRKKKIDLALTKFIAAVSKDAEISDGDYLTTDGKEGSKTNPYTRATSVDTKQLRDDPNCHDATYSMVKEELTVPALSYVLYDIRVYNEGETDVYAGEVTDHLPEYLEYVSCERNTSAGWKVASDGKTISTDILSYEKGSENLLKAFDKKNDNGEGSGLDYKDLQVLCRVSDKAPTNTKIVNIAEITKYEDENGNDISEDVDSKPNNVNEKNEDDDDYETILIKTFDLSLLKYVTDVYVTEDGKTTTTQTGNTGDDNKDIIPKVEVNKKKLNSTIVKFGYTIKVTNEGEIEGYAKEITDYVPQGLKFYSEDNEGWTDEGENVISTRLLENTLLKPGESAEVKVILRWINGSDNLGLKINVAEISEDYNKEGVPDRDSTPDNKKEGEDDIDSAPVLLSIKTGLVYNIVMYSTVGFVMLVILGAGIIAIKKFVL